MVSASLPPAHHGRTHCKLGDITGVVRVNIQLRLFGLLGSPDIRSSVLRGRLS